ncbi:MAG: hypothetical protein RIQ89_977 [Bacteroidota bacterium]|jgi:hypothetical protein
MIFSCFNQKIETMRKLILTIVAIATISLVGAQSTDARQKLTNEEKAQKASVKMQESLGLSKEQTQQVYELLLTRPDELNSNREARATWNKKKDASIQQILTAEQYTKYKTQQAQRKERVKSKRHTK